MTRISAVAPARVDLAGGSLDLWPLGLLVPGSRTVNVAISLAAHALLEPIGCAGVELVSLDLNQRYTWREGAPFGPLRLLERCCAHHGVVDGWRLTTRCGSPPGAGLGGSSALSVAVAAALATAAGRERDEALLVAECRDIEAQELGIPTGVQDFWPAVRGGALCLRYVPGTVEVDPLRVDLQGLEERMIVAYTGRSRLSTTTNWDLFRRFIEGDPGTRDALEGIAGAALGMEQALRAADWDGAGEMLEREMVHRARLASGIQTEEIAALFGSARQEGALGGKVCGAGGGGCLVFLVRRGYKEAVSRVLVSKGARVLDASPVGWGCRVEVEP